MSAERRVRRRRAPETIVSGGQTGADRAALAVARELGIPIGGFVPRGRRAEDGRVPEDYAELVETRSSDYRVRTERNVMASDATVIVAFGPLHGGSALTAELARRHRKPLLVLDLEARHPADASAALREFLEKKRPSRLNVAGPRESQAPGIHEATAQLLRDALS